MECRMVDVEGEWLGNGSLWISSGLSSITFYWNVDHDESSCLKQAQSHHGPPMELIHT